MQLWEEDWSNEDMSSAHSCPEFCMSDTLVHVEVSIQMFHISLTHIWLYKTSWSNQLLFINNLSSSLFLFFNLWMQQ